MPHEASARLVVKLKRTNLLGSVMSVLQWDEQVNLPPASGDRRGAQNALMAELHHAAAVDPEIGQLLDTLETDFEKLDGDECVIVRRARRDYDRAVCLPSEFVSRKAALDSEAFHVWCAARAKSDFAAFAPFLSRQLEMAGQEAAYAGFGDRPYNYFLDRHDPGMTGETVAALFAELRGELVPFARQIAASAEKSRRGTMTGFPVAAQDAFLRLVTTRLGFDFQRGRMDVAVHPFCSGDAADTRLTTRFKEDAPLSSLFGAIHEAGHGMYEQGLPLEKLGTPLAEAAGMSVHESQSRLWENQVGRGRAFWRFFEPESRAAFPGRLDDWSSEDLHRAANAVSRNPIRVDADEVGYNLHILLRFDLERRLFAGTLAVGDLPAAWNELSAELLQVSPENDARGVLQDVHWSGGAFGYFPSYCLGNMIAAQLWYTALRALPGLEGDFERGDFSRLLAWLRKEVHAHGRRYDTRELVERVTGAGLGPGALMRYLKERYGPLYLPATR